MRSILENDVKPILESILSLSIKLEILLILSFGGFAMGSVSGFISNWIYEPAVSFYFLMALVFCDHITGMTLAWRHNRFETRKAARIFWTLMAHLSLLVFATNLAKGSQALYWLNEGVFVPLVMVNFISLVKNLSLLGYVNSTFAKIFYKKVDVYKNQYVEKLEDAVPGSGDPVPRMPDSGEM